MSTLEHPVSQSSKDKYPKSSENFPQEQLAKIEEEYQRTLSTFNAETRREKERLLNDVFNTLSIRLTQHEGFSFSLHEQSILKLKLSRYLQREDLIDVNTLFDALIETPKFLAGEKGGLHKLLEIHEAKTLQVIAERRKQRAEMGKGEEFNPWENLFTTKSGTYYVARLLNMPHLEQESDYMNHCVGISDSYVNRIKKGEIEILSFRKVPEINPKTNKLEGDEPVITIEYNLKTNTIEQMKKKNDAYLILSDPYFDDVIDALKQLRAMPTDKGTLHNFVKIQPSELTKIPAKPDHVVTEHGEVHFKDYDESIHGFVLKVGKVEITKTTPKEDAQKLLKIVKNIEVTPDNIARTKDEINEHTKVYVGKLEPRIFEAIAHYHVENIYLSSLEGEITQEQLHIEIKTPQEWEEELKKKDINISGPAREMLYHKDFITLTEPETIDLVRLTFADLGFTGNATTKQIFDKAQELGLDLCPPEVGPAGRLKNTNQPLYEWDYIAMKQIADSGGRPFVFGLEHGGDGLWLDVDWAKYGSEWDPNDTFVFRLSPSANLGHDK